MSENILSFIVPLYNNIDATKAMLISLNTSVPSMIQHEIILIDDSSTDGTSEWLRSLNIFNLKTYSNKNNLGYSKTNNIAASLATGKYLILLNNDLIFQKGWLEPMLDCIQSPTLNVGIVGNVQYRVIDKNIDHAGIELTDLGKIEHIKEIDTHNNYKKVFATTGACMLMTREDFTLLGGFDETYVNGVEDVDLCMRMKQLGKAIYVVQNSRIYHHVSLSRDRESIKNEMNSQYFYHKWRTEIKSELSKRWAKTLSFGDEDREHSSIDGVLQDNFLMSPQLASRVLAEHFISREEARWKSLIDKIDLNEDLASKCSIRGMRYSEPHRCYLVSSACEFHVKDVDSVINFFVCGRRVDPNEKQNIAVIIDVNDIQLKRINLSEDVNINVGVISPILIKGIINIFKISFKFFDPKTNDLLGDANNSVVIGHFVLNDIELHTLR